jgi:hypothetical protein
MGTRRFCDLCGTTTNNLHGITVIDSAALANLRYAGLQQSSGLSGFQTSLTPTNHFDVEFCAKCLPVWLDRVKHLTQASNVSTEQDKTS